MFIGHFAAGFASKRFAPEISLGTMFLAAQFADLLWPTLLLLGVERVEIKPGITAVTPLEFVHYPYSHSLLTLILWGFLFALVYGGLQRTRRQALVLLGVLVVSHWFLDLIMHKPDLPLVPGFGPRVGLGLWNSLGATVLVEVLLFMVGVWLYARATIARDGIGNWALWGLVVFLLVVYGASLLGPPPPNVRAVAWTTQAMWLLVAWGYWIDRHRRAFR